MMDYRIFNLTQHIPKNLKTHFTIKLMAEMCDLSKEHFQKLFKREIGLTPIQFIRNLRLEKARELLESTRMRVKEIRYEIGIRDETHFIKDFKKKYRLSPTEFRCEYWNKFQSNR